MEKLELKHLAPYLPYELKCLNEMIGVFNTLKSKLETSDKDCTIEHLLDYDFYKIKPILRPLSDLTKQEFNSLTANSISYLINRYTNKRKVNYDRLPYKDFDKLLSKHYDVFGLIEKGLAIDINTL